MMKEKNLNENLGYRQHPSIANSDLRYLYSPRLFHAYKQGLLEKEEQKEYQSLGSIFEEFLKMDFSEFDKKYVIEPKCEIPTNAKQREAVLAMGSGMKPEQAYATFYTKPDSKKAQELYEKYQDYIAFLLLQTKDQRQIIPEAMFSNMVSMKNNVELDRAYIDLFHSKGMEIIPSLTIGTDKPISFWNVHWKGELDWLILNHIDKIAYVVDLKTTSKPLHYFHYEVRKYKIYRQLALYRKLAREFLNATGKADFHNIYVRIVVVETTGFNEAAVVPIPQQILQVGEGELEEAAELICWHSENGWETRRSQANNNGLLVYDWDELNMYDIETEENDE